MLGVTGILFAIPFAAISDYIYKEMIVRRLQERRGIAVEEEHGGSGQPSDEEQPPLSARVQDGLAAVLAAGKRLWKRLRQMAEKVIKKYRRKV